MAAKPLNSIGGFATGQDEVQIVFANGHVSVASILVSGKSELGPIGNVSISGGSSGQVITTDGSGNLSFTDATGGAGGDGQVPTLIPEGETYTVLENRQVLFNLPIVVNGDLVVNGFLIQVD